MNALTQWTAGVALVLMVGPGLLLPTSSVAQTDSYLERLSGFDAERVARVVSWPAKPTDTALASDAAKLVYQVNRLARAGALQSVEPTASVTEPLRVGQSISFAAQVTKIDAWVLPTELAEVLEFKSLYRVSITTEVFANEPVVVMASHVPQAWLNRAASDAEFKTVVTGIWLGTAESPKSLESPEASAAVVAASSLQWFATASDAVPADWALLGERGFDVGLLEGVKRRDRQALQAADSPAFYSLLRVAAGLTDTKLSSGTAVIPSIEPAADLLRESAAMIGKRIRTTVQTVRLTRVSIEDPLIRRLLQSDHYWQIDSIGDLGNVVIRIESQDAEPAIFEHRYPVSITMRDLPPDFLAQAARAAQVEPGQLDLAMISLPVVVDGFFYRLWSYDSEFMAQHGGGKQFGPLVIASELQVLPAPRDGDSGVSNVGWIAAALAILGCVAVVVGSWIGMRRDLRGRHRARQDLPERVEL